MQMFDVFRAELGIAIVQHVATAVEMSHPLQGRVASYLTHPARLRMICDASNGDPPAELRDLLVGRIRSVFPALVHQGFECVVVDKTERIDDSGREVPAYL